MSWAGVGGRRTSDKLDAASPKAVTIGASNFSEVANWKVCARVPSNNHAHDGRALEDPKPRNSFMAPGGQGERPCAYGKAVSENSPPACKRSSEATLESESVVRFDPRAANFGAQLIDKGEEMQLKINGYGISVWQPDDCCEAASKRA